MKYTLEEIYQLVGSQDKTAGLTFVHNSEAFKRFGPFLSVLFLYSNDERKEMDQRVKDEPFKLSGHLKAKYLGTDLSGDDVNYLINVGINSDDILEILYLTGDTSNTYHSEEQRTIKKIEIPMRLQPKGGDFDWMYGFSRKLVLENVGLSPRERAFYLAGKYYYEPNELTDDEKQEIFNDGSEMTESIEWEYLYIKLMKEEISDEETKRLGQLLSFRERSAFSILDKYLKQAGSSMKKLVADNIDQATRLYTRVKSFKDRRLNINGKIAIYLNIDSYLHIYMRHVEEFQVNKHFENKDNFQWDEKDVFIVMEEIIAEIDKEIQAFFLDNPKTRYSRYGGQSIYFEGDYYTFHIEPDGRISTFYKNRKT